MTDGLRLALTTLTVLPAGDSAQLDRRTAGQAMALAPLVGLLLGGAAAVVATLTHLAGTDLLAAALAVAVLALLTRGLHLDGLTDTVDGLASYRPADSALAVMRSPEVGPLGVGALVLVLLVQVAALQACLAAGRGTAAVLVAAAAGRLAVTLACTGRTPAASSVGLGAVVAGTVGRTSASLAAAAVLLLAFAAGLVDDDLPVLLAPVAVLVGLGAAAVLLRHVVQRLGGITGDVLGALVETTTTVVLVVLALRL